MRRTDSFYGIFGKVRQLIGSGNHRGYSDYHHDGLPFNVLMTRYRSKRYNGSQTTVFVAYKKNWSKNDYAVRSGPGRGNGQVGSRIPSFAFFFIPEKTTLLILPKAYPSVFAIRSFYARR